MTDDQTLAVLTELRRHPKGATAGEILDRMRASASRRARAHAPNDRAEAGAVLKYLVDTGNAATRRHGTLTLYVPIRHNP